MSKPQRWYNITDIQVTLASNYIIIFYIITYPYPKPDATIAILCSFKGPMFMLLTTVYPTQWAFCQIHKIAGCACAGNAGNVLGVSDPDMRHGTRVTHVPWCMPGSLTSGVLWSRQWGKHSRHSWRMHNPQFYVSGKRPILTRFHCARLLDPCDTFTYTPPYASCRGGGIYSCPGPGLIRETHVKIHFTEQGTQVQCLYFKQIHSVDWRLRLSSKHLSHAKGGIRGMRDRLWIFCGDNTFRVFDLYPRGIRDIS